MCRRAHEGVSGELRLKEAVAVARDHSTETRITMSIPTFPIPRGHRGVGFITKASLLLTAALWAPALAGQPASPTVPAPRIATLGTCRLAGDVLIADCRIAYRTYGRLSAARDNVVLIPTFFGGRSEDHRFML